VYSERKDRLWRDPHEDRGGEDRKVLAINPLFLYKGGISFPSVRREDSFEYGGGGGKEKGKGKKPHQDLLGKGLLLSLSWKRKKGRGMMK